MAYKLAVITYTQSSVAYLFPFMTMNECTHRVGLKTSGQWNTQRIITVCTTDNKNFQCQVVSSPDVQSGTLVI